MLRRLRGDGHFRTSTGQHQRRSQAPDQKERYVEEVRVQGE